MKKFLNNIWKIDLIFILVYFLLYAILWKMNFTFMPFIKFFATIFILLGYFISIIYGAIILISKRKIVLVISLGITAFIVTCGLIMLWSLIFNSRDEVTYFNNEKVIVSYTGGFLWNSEIVEFYKWTNPFIRTTKKLEIDDDYTYVEGKYWDKEHLKEYYPEIFEEEYEEE